MEGRGTGDGHVLYLFCLYYPTWLREGRGRDGGGRGEDRLLEELVSWDLFPSLHSQPLPPGSFTNDNGEVRSFMFHLHGATYRVVGAAGDGWSEKRVE